MKWQKFSEAVYGKEADVVEIDMSDIDMLKENIQRTPDKRIRICVHKKDSLIHEMIIVLSKDGYIRPHKHLNKVESFHMIEGEMDVIIFDDTGKVIKVIRMGSLTSGKSFFYRLSAPCFHTVILRTELVAFHEVTNGPLNKEETIVAPWSPSAEEYGRIDKFLKHLQQQVG